MSPAALATLTLALASSFANRPLFWVYGFPLILAFTLGLAFREHPFRQSSRRSG